MRLIDADKLIKECKERIENKWSEVTGPPDWAYAYREFIEMIEECPTFKGGAYDLRRY